MNYFLTETAWVQCNYGWQPLACGSAISLVLVAWASRRIRPGVRIAALAAAVLVLWIALFVSAEVGYSAWQGIPDPPDEAFSDTGPIFMLIMGWFPSVIILGIVHLLLQRCSRHFGSPPSPPPLPPKPA